MDAAFDRAAARLTKPMASVEYFRIVATVVAAVRDGHTNVRLSEAEDHTFRTSAPLLPFRFHIAKDRVWVLRDLREGASAPPLDGREVISIDGRPVRAILADMKATLEGDGSIPTSRAAALSSFRFNRLFGLLFGPSQTYEVRLRGLSRPISMPALSSAALTRIWEQRFPQEAARPPASLELRDEGIAILTIRSFAGHADLEGKQRLDAFLADSFGRVEERGVKALILDLRGNGGGRDELGRILLSYLIAHPNLGEHQPNPHRFRGRTFILMDGGSFSTTAEFLSLAHFHRLGTLIGEEAGGGYYGDSGGVVLDLTLPNSGLRIRLPMVRYEMAVEGFSPRDRGVPPAHKIVPGVADILAGRDRAMDLALELARRR